MAVCVGVGVKCNLDSIKTKTRLVEDIDVYMAVCVGAGVKCNLESIKTKTRHASVFHFVYFIDQLTSLTY
jgi:hypothetical protein